MPQQQLKLYKVHGNLKGAVQIGKILKVTGKMHRKTKVDLNMNVHMKVDMNTEVNMGQNMNMHANTKTKYEYACEYEDTN